MTPPLELWVAFRLFTLLTIVMWWGCAEKRLLSNASSSKEDVAKRVLEAVYHRDLPALEALTVTEEEYRTYIWPQSPVYKVPQWQKHYDFVWGQQKSRSSYSLRQMLSKYGGKKFTLVSVSFAGGTTKHNIYKAHRDARLLVIDEEGKERELKLFGSIMEMDGQYKIISYKTN